MPKRTDLVALHGLVDEQKETGDSGEEEQLHPHGHSTPGFGLDIRGHCRFGNGQGDSAEARDDAGMRDRLGLRVGGSGVSVLGKTRT